ncbi:MAG: hypothetical protein U1F15_16575 [Burkholderiales bacterium]
MFTTSIRVVLCSLLVLAAQGAFAQGKCTAKGQMGGQAFSLANCEVAFYAGGPSVAIWFSSTPIGADERDFFQRSSSADRFRKGRTMVVASFCPGGGSTTPSPKAAKSVEIAFTHATVLSLGPQDQWVLDPAKDKQIRIERLAGDLKKGGAFSGKITGAIAGAKPAFNWDLEFEFVLPQNAAGGGPGC